MMCNKSKQILFLLRSAMSWIFLWAFFDKLFGLGFATQKANAWIHGGSPTTGFLTHAPTGPLAPLYQSLAGNPLVDWLFMLGLLGIGLGLWIQKVRKAVCISGIVLMLLMWSATLLPENNPLIDDHIIYALVLAYLSCSDKESIFLYDFKKEK